MFALLIKSRCPYTARQCAPAATYSEKIDENHHERKLSGKNKAQPVVKR